MADPISAVRENGLAGLPGGLASGAIGVFAKPAIGTLDLISKTTEGLHKIGGEAERKRRRHPRYIEQVSGHHLLLQWQFS